MTNCDLFKNQSWACVTEMLSRLASVRIFLLACLAPLRGLKQKNSRILAFASSPIASAFLLRGSRGRDGWGSGVGGGGGVEGST